MRVKIKKVVECDVKKLEVFADVRYWEDAKVNEVEDTNGDLIPCRDGDTWQPVIDIDSGKILNWESGKTANVYYKVCDAGNYDLKNEHGTTELDIVCGYVPRCLCPKENGYGDYIILDINEDGFIDDWHFTLEGFVNEDE